MRPNIMKAKLAAGEPALGLSIMIPSPQLVEMAGGLGFDWVLIDCEHGSITLESAELMIMAAEAAGVTPIVRPRSKDGQDILQVLDRGAAGVQVPHIASGADARMAVEAIKFHPLGRRSLAAGTRASGYGYSGSLGDFTETANRELPRPRPSAWLPGAHDRGHASADQVRGARSERRRGACCG